LVLTSWRQSYLMHKAQLDTKLRLHTWNMGIMARAWKTWVDKFFGAHDSIDTLRQAVATLVQFHLACAWTKWKQYCQLRMINRIYQQVGLLKMRALILRFHISSSVRVLHLWRLNLMAESSKEQLRRTSDIAGYGLIQMLRSKENALEAASSLAAGIWLLRDVMHSSTTRHLKGLTSDWRSNVAEMTSRVLQHAIFMQDTLQATGKKMCLRVMHEVTKSWRTREFCCLMGPIIHAWHSNLNSAIEEIDLQSFAMMHEALEHQMAWAGARHVVFIFTRWSIDMLRRRIWNWRGHLVAWQRHFFATTLDDSCLVNEQQCQFGHMLWARSVGAGIKVTRLHRQASALWKLRFYRLHLVFRKEVAASKALMTSYTDQATAKTGQLAHSMY